MHPLRDGVSGGGCGEKQHGDEISFERGMVVMRLRRVEFEDGPLFPHGADGDAHADGYEDVKEFQKPVKEQYTPVSDRREIHVSGHDSHAQTKQDEREKQHPAGTQSDTIS